MKKKKIVFIIKYFYPIQRISGITNFLYEFCCNIAPKIHLTVIASKCHNDDRDEIKEKGFTIKKVGKAGILDSFLFYINSALVARKMKADTIVFFSGLTKNYEFLTLLVFNRILLYNQECYFCQCNHYGTFPSKIFYFIYSSIFSSYRQLLGMHPKIVDILKSFAQKKVTYLSPAINAKKLNKVRATEKGNKFRIGFFGHFVGDKGADVLLDYFIKKRDFDAELILAGEKGEIYNEILYSTSKNKNIKLLEHRKDVKSWIKSCDVIVLPYRTSREILGISLTALEAMYFGVPVIGYNTDCLNVLIKNGINGFLFENQNDLQKKIKLMFTNLKLREKIGKEAHRTVKEHYSINIPCSEFIKVIYAE